MVMMMMMAMVMTMPYIMTMFTIISDWDDDCDYMTINLALVAEMGLGEACTNTYDNSSHKKTIHFMCPLLNFYLII